jgi:hypothetical protein
MLAEDNGISITKYAMEAWMPSKMPAENNGISIAKYAMDVGASCVDCPEQLEFTCH